MAGTCARTMNRMQFATICVIAGVMIMTATASPARKLHIEELSTTGQPGTVEIRGVAAGAFNPEIWKNRKLHWVHDERFPLLEPRQGAARNIYAPSPVQVDAGWRIFYGAWDGTATGNDRIYSCDTSDFLEFRNRHTVIEHGDFVHVCNVNALRLPDNSFAMVCTGYPDSAGLNKPVFFRSPDGKTWNGSSEPYVARKTDIVQISGYDKYPKADINGMNVILFEEGRFELFFSSFTDFGKIWKASGQNGTSYTLDRVVLERPLAVNDVRKFRVGKKSWYLMGLHMNTNKLWYSLSDDASQFGPEQLLFENQGDADRHIVAIGWVLYGEQEKAGRRVLGVLYGAGAASSLDQNRLFASWLQKKVVLTDSSGRNWTPSRSRGPDTQLVPVGSNVRERFRVELLSEDGETQVGQCSGAILEPGKCYRLKLADK